MIVSSQLSRPKTLILAAPAGGLEPAVLPIKEAFTQIEAVFFAVSSTTASLSTGIVLAQSLACSPSLSADLLVPKNLDANLTAVGTFAGDLSTGIVLACDLAAQAELSGSLTDLLADLTASPSLSADLSTGIALSAPLMASAQISAQITTGIQLTSALAAESSLSGRLIQEARFFADVAVSSSLTGALTTGIALQAAVSAVTSLAADLTTRKPIAGALSMQATLSGVLSFRPDPANTFVLGGLSIPFESHIDLTQDYIEEAASRVTRHCDGSARKQTAWRGKIKTRLSGSGWYPPGLDLLDYAETLEMACIAQRAVTSATNTVTIPAARRADRGFAPIAFVTIDGGHQDATISGIVGNVVTVAPVDGAASYTVCYWPKINVIATPPLQQHDVMADSYRWSMEAEEA